MRKISIIILTVVLALFAITSCNDSVGDLFGFDVMFNANGGYGSMENLHVKGSSVSAPGNRFERDGYSFVSWNTQSDGYGTEYKVGDKVDGYSDLTVVMYAQWSINTYDIQVAAGASADIDNYVISDAIQSVNLEAKPEEGYELDYWKVEGPAGVSANGNTLTIPAGVFGNIAVTPIFKACIYDVTLYRNGGNINSGDVTSYTYGVGATLPTDITMKGFDFEGWFTDDNCTGTPVTEITATDIGNKSFYAKWNAVEYTVTINTAEHGVASALYDQYDIRNGVKYIPLTAKADSGYKFAGYTVEGGAVVDPNNDYLIVPAGTIGEITVTPAFEAITYSIAFDPNTTDATGYMLYEQFAFDEAKALSDNAYARDGYTFTGWCTRADGLGVIFDDKAEVVNLAATDGAIVTLYAQWNPTPYTITFENVDHGFASALYDEYTVKDDLVFIPLNAIAEEGYEFLGYLVGGGAYVDSTMQYLVIPAGTTSDITITPFFGIREYKINVTKSDRGTVVAASDVYSISNEDQTVKLTVTAQPHVALFDWSLDAPAGVNIKNNVLIIPAGTTGDITITADFLPAYKVTLVKNGGTVEAGYDVEEYFFSQGAVLPTADHITRTGYTFGGWFDNSGCTGTAITEIKDDETGSRTFYAKWTVVTYTVKFNKNSASATGSMSDESFQYDESKALTKNAFSRTGYTFSSWNTEATPSETTPGTSYTDEQTVSNLRETAGDVNLYAQWTANTYKVKFDKNATSATGTMSDQDFTYDVKQNLTTNAFTRTGYIFSGWNTVATPTQQQPGTPYADGAEVENLSTTQGAEVTLYAQWTPITYKVKFNTNSGTGTMGDESFTYDVSKALSKNTFTKTGYTFTGWNTVATPTQEEPGTAYSDEQNVSNLSSTNDDVINLYAQWEANTYTVKFDKNAEAATGSMTDQSFTYDVAKNLKINTYKNIGYSFTGWNTVATPTQEQPGQSYADKQSVSNLTETPDGEVTLYAQWEKETYAISISSGTEGYTVTPTEATYQYDPDNAKEIQLTITGAVPYVTTYEINGPSTASLSFDKQNSRVTINKGSYGGPIEIVCNFAENYNVVTFKANGGEGEDKTQNVPTDVAWPLGANTFTKEDYYFAGWASTAIGEIEYADMEEVITDEDLTLYAVWTDTPIEITADMTELEGGKFYGITNSVDVLERLVITDDRPVKIVLTAGNTLNLTKGIAVLDGQTLIIEGDGALVATAETETANAGIGGTYEEGKYDSGTVIIRGGEITATGNYYTGEYSLKYGSAGIGGARSGNGGTVLISGGTVTATGAAGGSGIGGGSGAACGTVEISGEDTVVTATGGNNGGAGIGGGSAGAGGTVIIDGGTVYATGKGGANGIGKGANATSTAGTLEIGSGEGLYAGPNKDNAVFVSGPTESYTGDRTYYMEVKPTEYATVTFDANGGTGTMASQTYPVGLPMNLNQNEFENTGKNFAVWTTDAAGTGDYYYDGSSITLAEDITLYAQWSETNILDPSYGGSTGKKLTGGQTYTIFDDLTIADRLYLDGTDPVTIVLPEGKTLTLSKGLEVGTEQSLIIDGEGSLAATGTNYKAGIGGGSGTNYGSITINGGNITATGSSYAAGIGGGEGTFGGSVTINGGTVNATGGQDSDGIGGESGSSYGGTLTLGSVAMLVSDDNTNWAAYDGTNRAKYMKTTEAVAITFKPNGATETEDVIQYAPSGYDVKLAKNTFTHETLYFVGWATGAEGDPVYVDEESVNVTEATTLYAKWGHPFITFSSVNQFSVNDYYGKAWDGTIEYSTDAVNWTEWDGTEIESSTPAGSKSVLYMKGKDNTTITGGWHTWLIDADEGTVDIEGNMGCLLDYLDPDGAEMAAGCFAYMFNGCSALGSLSGLTLPAESISEYCYSNMFSGCTSLETAPALPATTLAGNCYYEMFESCNGLTAAPELPATELAEYCYSYMFIFCTNLTEAPELPATGLAEGCYEGMFYYCYGLETAPELPATTLAKDCYREMFSGCTGLTTAPELPATTLVENCYREMFSGCTSLETAPALPATTLAENCYYEMFESCNSLTDAPALPATTLAEYCYDFMFAGCTSLETAPELPATELAEGCYCGMFYSCENLASAPELPAMTLANNCYDSMFSGCTSLTTAPELPATTLADHCYNYMFNECSGLTTAPELPATELAEYCYSFMFINCTSLTTSPVLHVAELVKGCYYGMFSGCEDLDTIICLATDISADYCTQSWVYGVADDGTFYKDPSMTGWSIGESGVPGDWTLTVIPVVLTSTTTEWADGNIYTLGDEDVEISDRITVTGNVTLLLPDGRTLTSSAGITVNEGNSLTIVVPDQSTGTGALVAAGGDAYAAAIGGEYDSSDPEKKNAGNITINGGNITAVGGEASAGIGGGYEGDCGIVTINGGTISATGNSAAGIGGGYYASTAGEIIINGGTVTATGGTNGAGIGSAEGTDCGVVTITGGTVTATGDNYGAGIGGGDFAAGGTVTISGESTIVNAIGGEGGAAGIGGGHNGNGGNVTISGGTVTATAGEDAQAIGNGNGGTDSGTLAIGEGLGLFGGPDSQNVEFLSCPTESYDGYRTAYMEAKATTYVTVTFDANTGTGTMEPQSVPYGFPASLNENEFEHESLFFLEWNTKDDGTGTSYEDMADISVESNTTLYAIWVYALPIRTGTTVLKGGVRYTVFEDVTNANRIWINGSDNVRLILPENLTLTLTEGLTVEEGNSLTIEGDGTLVASVPEGSDGQGNSAIGGDYYSPDAGTIIIESGTIEVTGGEYAAGIGGGYNGKTGTIIINGGTITATGGKDGAGIGSTLYGGEGTITINGGTVTAYGGEKGPGIGSGYYAGSASITINGGTVTSYGGEHGAGIGSGSNSAGVAITINDGEVNTTGGVYGAGIGTGYNCGTATITINGGTVTSIGGEYGSGIGGGSDTAGGAITITDGTVTATAGAAAAGIGSGGWAYDNASSTIVISGGTVVATGGEDQASAGIYGGAGIGGGFYSDGGTITISGENTSVTAYGGAHAAGIGCGSSADSAGTITISGGSIEANGGAYGTGIGCGHNSNVGTITITGGTITATGGENGAGIGSAMNGQGSGGSAGTITISGGDITANGGTRGAGIGSGCQGSGGSISISGESTIINATGGASGSGIGSGYYAALDSINISGGTITATGGSDAAAIGGGIWGDNVVVTISGGNITANGGVNAAAIGNGNYAWDVSITISGGVIVATGGENGAAIGCGLDGTVATITITGGDITATGGANGVGIGGGKNGTHGTLSLDGVILKVSDDGSTWSDYVVDVRHKYMKTDAPIILDDTYGNSIGKKRLEGGKTYTISGDLTISERLPIDGTEAVTLILPKDKTLTLSKGLNVESGKELIIEGEGTLIATGVNNAAGIGGLFDESAGTITINGGIINATGGKYAAGIGGGKFGDGGEVTILGGTVTAIGDSENGAVGIGHGYDGTENGTLTIGQTGKTIELFVDMVGVGTFTSPTLYEGARGEHMLAQTTTAIAIAIP